MLHNIHYSFIHYLYYDDVDCFQYKRTKKTNNYNYKRIFICYIYIILYKLYIFFFILYIYIFFLFYSLRRHARPVLRVYSTTANEKRSLEKRNNFPRWLVSIYRMIFVFFFFFFLLFFFTSVLYDFS